jgi:hypothetical protein
MDTRLPKVPKGIEHSLSDYFTTLRLFILDGLAIRIALSRLTTPPG